MKKILLLIALVCVTATAFAVNLSWSVQNLSYAHVKAVDVKQNANGIYTLMKIDYPGSTFATGDSDRIYIARYNSSGGVVNTFRYSYLQYAKQSPATLLLDNSGNVYVFFTNIGTTGFKEYFVLKLNSTLTTELGLFSPNLGSDPREANTMCFADNNTSIILATYKRQTSPAANLIEFTKIDLNGNQLWNYSINRGSIGLITIVNDLKVKSGRILACGTKLTSSGLYKIWALSLSNSGNLKFEFENGGSVLADQAYELEGDNSKNVYLCGVKWSAASNQFLWYMNKLDSAGNIKWTKTYIPDATNQSYNGVALRHMSIDNQNNLYYFGSWGYGSNKTRLVKRDLSGNQVWAKLINSNTTTAEFPYDLKVSSSGKVYFTLGQSNGSVNTHLFQYNSNGTKLDEDTCNITSGSGLRLADNNVLIFGFGKFGTLNVPAFAKFDATPIRQTDDIEFNVEEKTISFYPNPATTEVNFEYEGNTQQIEVSIYNSEGILVKQARTSTGKPFSVYDLPNGYYVISISSSRFHKRLKLLISH